MIKKFNIGNGIPSSFPRLAQGLDLPDELPPQLVLDWHCPLLPTHLYQVFHFSLRAFGELLSRLHWDDENRIITEGLPNDSNEARTSALNDMTMDWWYLGPHVDFQV